jgi:Mce-associated membrane protein
MAEHDGAAEETESVEAPALDDAEDIDAEEVDESDDDFETDEPQADDSTPKRSVAEWFSGRRALVAVGAAVVVALAGIAGWLGYRVHEDRQTQAQRSLYVQVARQTAINLTTISYSEVDADIKRILDSATGAFHDEFQNRSGPFIDVIKKVQSKTEGTIAEAGLLNSTDNQGQVLVAIAVKTSMAGAPADQEPRRWRMRITVDRNGGGAKVSKVEFVP